MSDKSNPALDALRRNVTGRVESGEAESITEMTGEDTSEDRCTDHGFDECPDCGNGGIVIDSTGYVPCTRFLTCWSDPDPIEPGEPYRETPARLQGLRDYTPNRHDS
jgi:hypothetical protein